MVSIHRPPAHEARIKLLKENILTREGIEHPTYDLAIIALQLSYLVFTFVCLWCCYFYLGFILFQKKFICCMKIWLTGGGIEPPTFGLWAQHATSAPSRFS